MAKSLSKKKSLEYFVVFNNSKEKEVLIIDIIKIMFNIDIFYFKINIKFKSIIFIIYI